MPVLAPGTGASLWTPAALGKRLLFWIDASDTSTLTLSGNEVTVWRDKSLYRRDLSTDTSNPTFGTNKSPNGIGLVTTNGTNQSMFTATMPAIPQPIWIVAVFKLYAADGNNYVIPFGQNAAASPSPLYFAPVNKPAAFAGTELLSSLTVSVPTRVFLQAAVLNGTTSEICVNGTRYAYGNAGTSGYPANDRFIIGRTRNNFYYNIDYATIVMATNITGAEFAAMQYWAAYAFGISSVAASSPPLVFQ